MITFEAVTQASLPRLADWIQQDEYHKTQNLEDWLMTPALVLQCWLHDDQGPVMYVMTERDDDFLRIHIQFGPENEVSKRRIVRALFGGWPKFLPVMKEQQAQGIWFTSKSPTLIHFMDKFGFKPWRNDDYLLSFGS
jgi:hypothetical protein